MRFAEQIVIVKFFSFQNVKKFLTSDNSITYPNKTYTGQKDLIY